MVLRRSTPATWLHFAFRSFPPCQSADSVRFDALAVTYLGTCQVALAYYCLTKGIRKVPAFEASAVMLVEPALNPVWTWLILGERPALLACLGGAILLAATGNQRLVAESRSGCVVEPPGALKPIVKHVRARLRLRIGTQLFDGVPHLVPPVWILLGCTGQVLLVGVFE